VGYELFRVDSLSHMERLPDHAGYRMHYFPAPEGVVDANPIKAATALNQGVAQCARAQPAQYQWSYRRFRRQLDQDG